MMDPLSYFLFQLVLHDWCNKDSGMCYPAIMVVYITEPLLLIRNNNPYNGGSRFPISISEWAFTMCPMPYNFIQKC